MATLASRDSWIAGAIGRQMNPDNAYGLQCKDVADDYCIALFGNWVNTIRPGNGKDVFNNANATYFTKIANDTRNSAQIPERGDIINWGASRAVPEGHVAVVVSATQSNVTVIQQDGYLQYPARQVTLSYLLPNGAMTIGWLRPKFAEDPKLATDSQIRTAYLEILERPADDGAIVHYRSRTIDFVRADLLASGERKQLDSRKAAEAEARAKVEADAIAAKKAAEEAEANRIELEKQAAIEAKRIADEAIKAAKEAEDKLKASQSDPQTWFLKLINAIFTVITNFIKGVK